MFTEILVHATTQLRIHIGFHKGLLCRKTSLHYLRKLRRIIDGVYAGVKDHSSLLRSLVIGPSAIDSE